MLDKSVPYADIVMRLPADAPVPAAPKLRNGYAVRMFRPGEEKDWCSIETSVGEFDSEDKALEYFDSDYRPYYDLLPKRMVFAVDPEDRPVATASAWFFDDKEMNVHGGLHWVACRPERQGNGLGRAVVETCLRLSRELDPGRDVYLHTQTWSHRAILLYLSLGFRPQKETILAHGGNDYEKALPVLRDIFSPEQYELFVNMTD